MSHENLMNVLLKNIHPSLTTPNPDGGKAMREATAAVHAANDKKFRPDGDWQAELEYLDRLLKNSFTETQMKEAARNELAKLDTAVHNIELSLTQLRAALETQYIRRDEAAAIRKKIEHLMFELGEAQRLRERKIALNGSGIKAAREKDKLRPRWLELKKREADIRTATNLTREV